MEDHVYNVCGVRNRKMTLFRPPFGDFNRELTLRVNRQGYTAARSFIACSRFCTWLLTSSRSAGRSTRKTTMAVMSKACSRLL